MTTKELINQYVTAHADNRWMDASELEALLTEFAEKLKEPASEDLEKCVVEQMEADGDVDDFVRRGIDDIASKYAQLGAQWQKKQMMKDAVEAVVSQVPCANEIIFRNPASVSYWYLPSEMNRLGINKGDKVKVIIVKE